MKRINAADLMPLTNYELMELSGIVAAERDRRLINSASSVARKPSLEDRVGELERKIAKLIGAE